VPIDARLLPQLADPDWVDAGCMPPSSLVAGAMYRAMIQVQGGNVWLVADA